MVVHDMHEYPPGGPADSTRPVFKVPVLLSHVLWNKISMRWVDHVFTANNIVRGYVLSLQFRMTVDILYNVPSQKLFPQAGPKRRPAKGEPLLLCHEGALLLFHRGLKEMIEAVYLLRGKVHLRIVGDVYGKERAWLTQAINEWNIKDSITLTGWLPYEKVGEAINGCHLGLIFFKDCINNRLAGPPNKVFLTI